VLHRLGNYIVVHPQKYIKFIYVRALVRVPAPGVPVGLDIDGVPQKYTANTIYIFF
jgi:hypothetical protein